MSLFQWYISHPEGRLLPTAEVWNERGLEPPQYLPATKAEARFPLRIHLPFPRESLLSELQAVGLEGQAKDGDVKVKSLLPP